MQHYTCACLQKGQPIKQRRLNHGEGEEELHLESVPGPSLYDPSRHCFTSFVAHS